MKNYKLTTIILAAMGLISYNAVAQNSKDGVPQAVSSSFSMKYSQAHLRSWKMKHDTCIASFSMNKRSYMAYYSPDGSWLSTERNIKHSSSLPMAARTYLKNGKYASWHVDRMAKVQTPTQTMYMVHIDNHSGNPSDYQNGADVDKRLYFASNGKLVKAN